MKEIIFYGSYLVFPFLIFIIFSTKIRKYIKIILCILSLLFIESRFIEPQLIHIKHSHIDLGFNVNIALIGDLHIGKYKKTKYLQRVIENLNDLQVDMLLIAGDLTYNPNLGELGKLFAPFKDLNIPTYWVLGNHDVEKPGPKIRDELIQALDIPTMTYMNNTVVKISSYSNKNNQDTITLIGLGSNWNNEDDVSLLNQYSKEDNVIVLTHNPDTVNKYTNNIADLTFAGHTHGGQIRIPWLYKKVIPTKGNFDKGLSYEQYGPLYITAGLGETGLPMRFLNPPTIDILHIR